MAHVFISYSSKDRAIANTIGDSLKNRGHNIWIDQKKIKVGDQWDTSIAKAITSSEVFILLLSPYSVQSSIVKKEYNLAEESNKLIIPVIIKALVIPDDWKFNLSRTQILFYEGNQNITIEKLLTALSDSDQTVVIQGEGAIVDGLMNEQIRIISFWIRQLLENGSVNGDFVIFIADGKKNIYIQLAKNESGSLHLEASSKLTAPYALDNSQKEKLIQTGWQPAEPNYYREVSVLDNNKLNETATLILLTLMHVYGFDSNNSIIVQHSF